MGKVIVITGAGIGLGRALARRFAGEGETVVLLGDNAFTIPPCSGIGSRIRTSSMPMAAAVTSMSTPRCAYFSVRCTAS